MYMRIERDAPAKLWISAVAGGAPIRATNDPKASAEFPGSWSPDGAWFVYSAVVDGNVNLMKVKTSGEAAPVTIKTNLSDGSRQSRSVPDWSPAGNWIVFGSLLISPDGKTERPLGSHGSLHYAFSKDGKLVYGMAPENGRHTLFSIDVATGAKRTIAQGISYAPLSNLTPSMRFSLAPDGKSLLYGTGVITNSLWILEGFNPPDSLLARLGWRR